MNRLKNIIKGKFYGYCYIAFAPIFDGLTGSSPKRARSYYYTIYRPLFATVAPTDNPIFLNVDSACLHGVKYVIRLLFKD
jgi:hypothetical protein